MEVAADLGQFFDSQIARLDTVILKKLNPRKFPVISSMVDRMGKLSSEAQRLKRTLTTYEKILDSADDQFLYILWEPGVRPNTSAVIGLLKVGYKNLYLFDRTLKPYKVKPLCVLDFYVHSSKQRQGFGHRLYDHMLERESLAPSAVAIDKPSESLLAFLSKHYGLTNPIWQSTNFVVYPQFFQIIDADKDSLNGREHEKSPRSEPKDQGDGFCHSAKASGVSSPVSTPCMAPEDMIARSTGATVSNAQMAKGRKITSMDHQHLW